MSAGREVDVLFEVRNAFFIGDYQHCITESQKIKVRKLYILAVFCQSLMPFYQAPNAVVAIEKDVLMYRAYLAQNKFSVVLNEVSKSSPAEVQSVRLLAEYLSNVHNRYCVIIVFIGSY